MLISKNVRCIPKWVEKIPLLNMIGGSAVYPYIFLKCEFYENLASKNPKPKTIAVLTHEQTHIKRAKQKGALLWMLLYGFVPSFRVNEELAADREAMKYWKSRGLEYDFDRRAHFLSGLFYLWPISYEEAKKKLIRIWNEA